MVKLLKAVCEKMMFESIILKCSQVLEFTMFFMFTCLFPTPLFIWNDLSPSSTGYQRIHCSFFMFQKLSILSLHLKFFILHFSLFILYNFTKPKIESLFLSYFCHNLFNILQHLYTYLFASIY